LRAADRSTEVATRGAGAHADRLRDDRSMIRLKFTILTTLFLIVAALERFL
jgi:hypothetical protein